MYPPLPWPQLRIFAPQIPGPTPPSASTPLKYQSCSINSRVPCQVHSLTSQITHAKPQVFYETFPVTKTFLWGFIFLLPFFFPSPPPPPLPSGMVACPEGSCDVPEGWRSRAVAKCQSWVAVWMRAQRVLEGSIPSAGTPFQGTAQGLCRVQTAL